MNLLRRKPYLYVTSAAAKRRVLVGGAPIDSSHPHTLLFMRAFTGPHGGEYCMPGEQPLHEGLHRSSWRGVLHGGSTGGEFMPS